MAAVDVLAEALRSLHRLRRDFVLEAPAPRLSSGEVESTVSTLERRIKDRFPDITRAFIEAQRSSALTAGIAAEQR